MAVPTVFAAVVGLTILSGGFFTGEFAFGTATVGAVGVEGTGTVDEVTIAALNAFLDYFGASSFGVLGGVEVTPEIVAASIAAGTQAAKVADYLGQKIVRAYPRMFMSKERFITPGAKYFEITGGPGADADSNGTDLQITEITPRLYSTFNVSTVLHCIEEASQEDMQRTEFVISDCGDKRAVGVWFEDGDRHSGRPRYRKDDDPKWIIEWSASRKAWRMFYDETLFGYGRKSIYESKENTGRIPNTGWEICSYRNSEYSDCTGVSPLPSIEILTT